MHFIAFKRNPEYCSWTKVYFLTGSVDVGTHAMVENDSLGRYRIVRNTKIYCLFNVLIDRLKMCKFSFIGAYYKICIYIFL